jgi:hypothetical protein
MARIARLPDWRTSLATALPDVIAPAGEDA